MIIKFVKQHQQWLKGCFYILLFIVLAFFIRQQLQDIDWLLFQRAISQQSWPSIILLVTAALLGFSVNGFYDVVATQDLPLPVNRWQILKIGWISQAFNEFIDIAGLTGGTLRIKFYRDYGLETKNAVQLSLMNWFASFLGLVFLIILALPFAFQMGWTWQAVLPAVFILYLPLFLFGERLPWLRKYLEKSNLQLLTTRKKLSYILVSIGDWLAALSYFLLVCTMFVPHFNLTNGLVVYTFAIVIGIFSFLPGGVGAFDVTVLLAFEALGYETSHVLAALVVLRVCYYLIPWLLASGYVTLNWFKNKTKHFHHTYFSTLSLNLVTLVLFTAGTLLILTALIPEWFDRVHFLKHLIPHLFNKLSAFVTLLIGMITVLLSLGIRAQVHRVYQIAMLLLPIGAILCILRGFSYKEALWLGFVWLLLFANRKQFFRSNVPLTAKNIFLATCLSLLVLGGTTLFVSWRILQKQGEIVITLSILRMLVILFLVTGLMLLVLFSQSSRVRFSPPSSAELEQFEHIRQTYGGSEYSSLVHMHDKQIFLYKEEAALLFRAVGRNMLVLGDPIGRPDLISDMLIAFAEYAHQYKMTVAYYQVTPKYLDEFCNMGYLTIKIGESAHVPLEAFSFEGKANRNFRKIRNAMENEGLTFEICPPPHAETFYEELKGVSDDWLGKRHEMAYSLGAFKTSYLATAPIAILRKNEHIVAFANILPINKEMISIDMMRHRKDAPDNAMQMLFLQLFQWAKEEGYAAFDLGMAPLTNVGNQTFSRSRDQLVRLVYEYGNRIYGFKGLRAYKEKFRPRWENRYIIYPDGTALPQILLALLEATNRSAKESDY